ncbi:MAG: YicC/YloC family endoribonuclease [Candidatus Brocadiia bacterium]
MTGYGQGRREGDGCVVSVEVRAVNSRYFKLSARLPPEFTAAEGDLEKQVRQHVRRGSVDLFVKVEFTGARAAQPLNRGAVVSYVQQLREIGAELGVTFTLNADALAALPGVLEPDRLGDEEGEELLRTIQQALDEALTALDRMRAAEGTNLADQLARCCEAIERRASEVEAGQPDALSDYKERLAERVNRLLDRTDVSVTERELAREIAIYAERSSVSEEAARLRSHVQQFREALARDKPVGRRLEFLAQEMHREVNTMGAKVSDADLSRRVVDLHAEVDKIREQVLNVE